MTPADKVAATIAAFVLAGLCLFVSWLTGADSVRQEAVEMGYAHYDPQDRSFVWGPAYVTCHATTSSTGFTGDCVAQSGVVITDSTGRTFTELGIECPKDEP